MYHKSYGQDIDALWDAIFCSACVQYRNADEAYSLAEGAAARLLKSSAELARDVPPAHPGEAPPPTWALAMMKQNRELQEKLAEQKAPAKSPAIHVDNGSPPSKL